MNREKQYKMLGRYEAKRLFPIPDATLCTDCETAIATDHHHIDGNTHNNTPSNVIFLCRVCHLRRERKENRVGSRSRLTSEQIRQIKYGRGSITKLSRELGFSPVYLQRIRKGKRNPKPVDAYKDNVIPADFQWKERRGKPRALSVEHVKEILGIEKFTCKHAVNFSERFNVAYSTIWKARGRHGCYSDPTYNALSC